MYFIRLSRNLRKGISGGVVKRCSCCGAMMLVRYVVCPVCGYDHSGVG